MSRLQFPHPLTLLVACILLATGLTWVLPAGEYQRRDDPATGRSVVVAGTYHRVAPAPVGPFEALVSIPRGIADAAPVIGLIFLIGGAFTVVERAGVLSRLVAWLVGRLAHRQGVVIPVACAAFSIGGIMMQMQEELIAFVPMLLLLTRQLGYTPLVAVAISLGAAAVGAAFSPVNPFQVAIAQKVAELPPASGWLFRSAILLPALILWIWGTSRYARRTRVAPAAARSEGVTQLAWRDLVVLCSIAGAFGLYVYGAQRLGWEFDQLSALFFLVGVAAGMVGGLGLSGTADGFVEGFRSMALAGLLVGFARAIYVVLNDGRVVDTVVNGLFSSVASLPVVVSAVAMMAAHTIVHLPVPSTSSQAVLTLPLLVPLSDLVGLSRQVTVLAFQYGAGLCEILTPTNGALMAMLAAAGVRYDDWLRFTVPLYGLLVGLAVVALALAVTLGV